MIGENGYVYTDPGRDISFSIFIGIEIETRKLAGKANKKSYLNDLFYLFSDY